MKIEIIILIFLIVLNVSLVYSQDPLNVQDTEINKLKERITTLEHDINELNVSEGYFAVVITVTTAILSIIVGVGLWFNIYTSRQKLKDMVSEEIINQKKRFDSMKNESVENMDEKLDSIKKDINVKFQFSEANINRALADASDDKLVSAIWRIRAADKYDKVNQVTLTRNALQKATNELKNVSTGTGFPTNDLYTEIVVILGKLDKETYSREIKIMNKEIDRIYGGESDSLISD